MNSSNFSMIRSYHKKRYNSRSEFPNFRSNSGGSMNWADYGHLPPVFDLYAAVNHVMGMN